jgi:mono/diheme cytochrome c family protein
MRNLVSPAPKKVWGRGNSTRRASIGKDRDVTHVQRRLIGVACLGLAGLLGCQPASAPNAAPPPGGSASPSPAPASKEEFDADSGPFAAGKKVVVAKGCFKCHAINGVRGRVEGAPGGPGPGGPDGPPPGPGGFGRGGPGGGRAPDLGKVGGDEEHSIAWLMDYIRNPKSKKPNAKMPPFEGKIKEDDLRAMAEYLASLK